MLNCSSPLNPKVTFIQCAYTCVLEVLQLVQSMLVKDFHKSLVRGEWSCILQILAKTHLLVYLLLARELTNLLLIVKALNSIEAQNKLIMYNLSNYWKKYGEQFTQGMSMPLEKFDYLENWPHCEMWFSMKLKQLELYSLCSITFTWSLVCLFFHPSIAFYLSTLILVVPLFISLKMLYFIFS